MTLAFLRLHTAQAACRYSLRSRIVESLGRARPKNLSSVATIDRRAKPPAAAFSPPLPTTFRTCYLLFDHRVRRRFGRPQNAVLDFKIGAIGAQKLVPTQTPIDPRRTSDTGANPKIHRVEVYWTAVTYKTVAVYVILGRRHYFRRVLRRKPELLPEHRSRRSAPRSITATAKRWRRARPRRNSSTSTAKCS